MTSQQSAKLILGVLSVLTLAVLCVSIWKMLGTLAESSAPAPIITRAPSNTITPDAPPRPQPVTVTPQVRIFPARVGNIIDVSKNPDFADLPGTKVSMDLSNVELADAVAAFTQATSLAGADSLLQSSASRDVPPVTMHLKDAPLMEAVLEWCSRTDTLISDFSLGQLRLQTGPLDGSYGQWSVAGPFALSLVRIETSVQFDPRISAKMVAQLSANLIAEPSARVASFTRVPIVETATDENGNSIGTLASASLSRGSQSAPTFGFSARWNLVPGHGRKIAHLRGTIQMAVANKSDTFQHDLGGTDPYTQTIHGVKFELSPMESTAPTRYTVKLHLTRGDAEALYWQQLLATIDDIGPRMLLDDRPMRPSPAGTSSPNPNERIFTFLLTTQTGASPPQQFTLDIPTDLRQVHIPFEFTDVLLP